MNHIKIRIGTNLSPLDREFRSTLDTMYRMMNPHFTLSRHSWQPHTDIFEMGSAIIVTVELAGVDIADIHVEVDRRTVKISGLRREMPHREEGSYLLAEIPSGYFERILTLPSPIDPEAVAANYAQGMLQIRLEKRNFNTIHTVSVRPL